MFDDEEQYLAHNNKRSASNNTSMNPSNGRFDYRKNQQRSTLHDEESLDNGSHFTIKNKENFLEGNLEQI